jgi:hypothetical protein
MGKFADSAAQVDISRRGDGTCVVGKWVSENLDESDLTQFVRLVSGHKWKLIERLSDNNLRQASLIRHVHGNCPCLPETVAKGCCPCDQTKQDA